MERWDTFRDRVNSAYEGGTGPYIPTLTVRYEDLCEEPNGVLGEILRVAGMSLRTDGQPNTASAECGQYFGKNLHYISPKDLDAV